MVTLVKFITSHVKSYLLGLLSIGGVSVVGDAVINSVYPLRLAQFLRDEKTCCDKI